MVADRIHIYVTVYYVTLDVVVAYLSTDTLLIMLADRSVVVWCVMVLAWHWQ